MALSLTLPRAEAKVVTLIGVAHFFSHFYILVLPPLFPLLHAQLGVSFAALGLAFTMFHVTSGVAQPFVGYLVDRIGARGPLVAGLALLALATLAIGLLPVYAALLVMMALAGLGNSVFHPADYAILSASVAHARMGRAFAIHTFAGYLGGAVAPPVIVLLATLFGWQSALVAVGCVGLGIAALLATQGHLLRDDRAVTHPAAPAGGPASPATRPRPGAGESLRLMLSPAVLTAFLFFALMSMAHDGYGNFSVSALAARDGVALTQASLPLTLYLFASAFGVLAGGLAADRTERHGRLAALCFLGVALATLPMALTTVPLGVAVGLFLVAGFFTGFVAPARDLMVRAITPPGSSGRVFGFVSTGFNVGGAVAPPVFGYLLDLGAPEAVFGLITVFAVATLVVSLLPMRPPVVGR